MPNNPKGNEQKLRTMINAWETLAPTKSFGGMTLAQFKALADPSFAARQRITDLESQTTQAINDRDAADATVLGQAQLVVAGVLADPTEGKNSSLYEAMGYVRQIERRSGLTRAKKPTGPSKPS